MSSIPLFTSIPPSITRLDKAGRNVGERYVEYCIESWRISGFNPISINSSSEGIPEYLEHQIENISVDHDAHAEYQKPVLYLNDFIDAILNNHEGVVAITKADIVLEFSGNDKKIIEGLNQNECII